VPEICRFHGIVIKLRIREHNPPHFHAEFGDSEASILIGSGEPYAGELPSRAMAMLLVWTRLHRAELLDNWQRLRDGKPTFKIEPLE
jgi:hypothetical protein